MTNIREIDIENINMEVTQGNSPVWLPYHMSYTELGSAQVLKAFN